MCYRHRHCGQFSLLSRCFIIAFRTGKAKNIWLLILIPKPIVTCLHLHVRVYVFSSKRSDQDYIYLVNQNCVFNLLKFGIWKVPSINAWSSQLWLMHKIMVTDNTLLPMYLNSTLCSKLFILFVGLGQLCSESYLSDVHTCVFQSLFRHAR